MTHKEKALKVFDERFNCAQAVFAAFAEELGMPEELAMKTAICFGGGMQKGEVCGAVSGALMVLGMKYGDAGSNIAESKAVSYRKASEFMNRFGAETGSCVCKELLKCDISTPEGADYARKTNLFYDICPRMVESAVKVLEDMEKNSEYDLVNAGINPDSQSAGKTVVFLGSSVTYGAASGGLSFADYLCKRNGINMIKEAVSGTTLVDNGPDSYISRMKKIDREQADLFVCQLSTNDATRRKPLGTISAGKAINDFDTGTIAGAIEYITAYAEKRWHCPVVFYSNPRYDSEEYAEMVELLKQLSDKWGFKIIDLWNNGEFNNISEEERKLYMADPIHPTKAGYLKWWVPFFEDSGVV